MEKGYYWAKSSKECKWWNIILFIHGEEPFLNWTAWIQGIEQRLETGHSQPGFVIGPKISKPD